MISYYNLVSVVVHWNLRIEYHWSCINALKYFSFEIICQIKSWPAIKISNEFMSFLLLKVADILILIGDQTQLVRKKWFVWFLNESMEVWHFEIKNPSYLRFYICIVNFSKHDLMKSLFKWKVMVLLEINRHYDENTTIYDL